jgi:dolichol-phosphate mannosyltransferase
VISKTSGGRPRSHPLSAPPATAAATPLHTMRHTCCTRFRPSDAGATDHHPVPPTPLAPRHDARGVADGRRRAVYATLDAHANTQAPADLARMRLLDTARARLRDSGQLLKFGLVGCSGIFVNMFFLWFFTERIHFHYMISSPIAVELSIVWNFLLNNAWTFRDSTNPATFLTKMLKFHLTAFGGFAINYIVLVGLTELVGLYYLLSNLAGIAVAFAWNYAVNVSWTWRHAPE